MIQPLDWPQLVAEALRRRKAEGLTQQAHADLAGVSKPVIIAFDKGQTTLSLGRALAILKVVGLVQEGPPPGSHAAFVAAARARWQDLIARLPADDPARHPLGGYEVDYEIRGVKRPIAAADLQDRLRSLVPAPDMLRWRLGLRPFWVPTREDWQPQVTKNGEVEWWYNIATYHVLPSTPADRPFWCISPNGHAFLTTGLNEDGPDVRYPGTYFDVTFPIQSTLAVMLHAAALASILRDGDGDILFRTRYRGLSRRRLVSFADPADLSLSGVGPSHSDIVELTVQTTAEQIRADLPSLVHRFLSPLYDRFSGFALSREQVALEVSGLERRPGHLS